MATVSELSRIPASVVDSDPIPGLIATIVLCLIYLSILRVYLPALLKIKQRNLKILGLILTITCMLVAIPVPIEQTIIAILLGVGLCLSLLSPLFAANILLSVLVIRPWDVCANNLFLEIAPKAFAGFALASWVIEQIRTKTISSHHCSAVGIYLLWLAWLLFASLIKGLSLEPIFSNFVPATTVAFLLYNTPKNSVDLQLQRNSLEYSILAVVINALYLTLSYSSLQGQGRLETLGLWSNSNDVGALIAVALGLTLSRAILFKQPTAFPMLVFFAICAWFTQSRATFLAIALASGTVFNLSLPRNFKTLKLVAIMLMVSLGGLAMLFTSRSSEDLAGSASSRKAIIMAGIKMAKEEPLLGVGVKRFPELYGQYTNYYEDSGALDAHNSWILALAEAGVPGFVLFSSLMLLILRESWLLRGFAPAYLPLLIAYLTTMTFLSHTYIFLPYVIVGAVLGASRVHQQTRT